MINPSLGIMEKSECEDRETVKRRGINNKVNDLSESIFRVVRTKIIIPISIPDLKSI